MKTGPPVVARRWSAEAVKAAIADPQARRLRDVEATVHEPPAFDIADRLRRMRWQQNVRLRGRDLGRCLGHDDGQCVSRS